MSNELDRVRETRPDVPSPTSQARDAAREQLRLAMVRAAVTVPRSSPPVASGLMRSRHLRRLGALLTAATSVALVVAVVAIVLLPHPRGRQRTGVGRPAAVRGAILDQAGGALAVSRAAVDVQINPVRLPRSARSQANLFAHLAHILHVSTAAARCPLPGTATRRLARIPCAVAQGQASDEAAAVTVAAGVSPRVAAQIGQLPGVSTVRVVARAYPHAALAAQVIGTVGPKASNPKSAAAAHTVVGQSGLESEYNRLLQAGDSVRTSLNPRLQRVGQSALAESMSANASPGGAFVAMNPDNGQVYAMGSLPSYDPSVFTGNLSQAKYDALTNPNGGDPLLNRAIQSVGPTGSTFKPITATAALSSGLWSVGSMFDDTGQFCVGSGGAQQCRHNSGHAVDGSLNLVNALRVSSDDFFYNLGALTNADPSTHPQGGPLDTWARNYGIGRVTGIDLPAEVAGTLPTPAWRAQRNRLESECDRATGPFRGKAKHAPGGCGIADGTDRPWSIGDNESLAVGQGDVQVTPLQLAVAYAALANGGTVVRPHLGLDIQDQDGTVLQSIDPPPSRHIPINPFYRQTILDGLHDAAQTAGGTSDDVMGNFPETVYGKTGTAQYTGQPDYAWYACFVQATATTKPIVVVVHVEKGGFGDIAAAPVAREILSQYFFGKPGKYVAGTSTTL